MFNQGSVGYCQVMYVNIVTLGILLHAGHCCSLVLSLGRIVSFFFFKKKHQFEKEKGRLYE